MKSWLSASFAFQTNNEDMMNDDRSPLQVGFSCLSVVSGFIERTPSHSKKQKLHDVVGLLSTTPRLFPLFNAKV